VIQIEFGEINKIFFFIDTQSRYALICIWYLL